MAIQKPPAGTRGARTPPRPVMRLLNSLMLRVHKRQGDRMGGMPVLYLTTTGARTGERRTTPVARVDDGRGGWYVVASAGGAAKHPGWYHNLAAHPDQAEVEFGGRRRRVRVEQLEGAVREEAWADIVRQVPRFGTYPAKTDRQIPVLRLTPES